MDRRRKIMPVDAIYLAIVSRNIAAVYFVIFLRHILVLSYMNDAGRPSRPASKDKIYDIRSYRFYFALDFLVFVLFPASSAVTGSSIVNTMKFSVGSEILFRAKVYQSVIYPFLASLAGSTDSS